MPKFQSDIDNSAILYLALIRKDHTNVYRFTLTMSEQVDAALLQRAVDRVHDRFPSIFAGFRPGFFRYTQVHSARPPQVQEDPGCLITMTGEEIAQCAYRVYYRENRIIIEAFHALTDGYGAAASFSTLAAEYLSLRYGIHVPYGYPVMDSHGEASVEELENAYLKYADAKPLHLPSRYSYQLPGKEASHRLVLESPVTLPLSDLLNAAKKRGVSVTALLSAILAYSIMEIQQQSSPKKQRPVRIMVPVDLRRIFPSATLRNFILYALPTMEPKDCRLSLEALAAKFSRQIKDHLEKENLAGIMAYNVKTQNSFLFRLLPSKLKCFLMRVAYRYFGESNSSITFTNLGNLTLPEEMLPYVKCLSVTLTPRARSPYNCSMISYNGQFQFIISRFPEESGLEDIFYGKLHNILYGGDNQL